VGGDGTILYAVKEFKGKAPPLVSFQRGSLGFMCRFYIGKIAEVIEKLALYHQRKIEQPFKV
jgi:NAD kinase